MEVANNEIGESGLPTSSPNSEATALDIIRTETVLSRLPVHNLAKKGNVNIQILKTNAEGKVELKWIVSYSDRYGQARQLAYKLDTIVINHHIDEQGRPLPKMICLGSLRDIADQLDLGGDTNKVRRALRQNASAFITAKFEYRGNDGSKKTLEADFTRYSVVFTGEQLPDGQRADAVYIILNEPYREVLNNAPVRPLDRAYMKLLTPAAQRFYEIISYKMFSAIKNDYPHAKIQYSEYCTFSAQLRHFERQPVQDQMAKVIRHHKESGYITAVRYEPMIDSQNQPDWMMYLTPGPKARTEFAIAHGKLKVPKASSVGLRYGTSSRGRTADRQQSDTVPVVQSQPALDPQLLAEFTSRGITEKKTLDLLANLKSGQDVVAQLEIGDHLVKNSRVPIVNPPGFYIRLIESNTSIPDGFETSTKRKAREEKERQDRERRAAEDSRQQLEWEYDDYCQSETERYIAENPAAFDAAKDAARQEIHAEHPAFSDDMVETMAQHGAKTKIQQKTPLLTFEEFVSRRKQATDFSLKPVSPSPSAELVPPDSALPEESPMDREPVSAPAELAVANNEPENVPAATPAIASSSESAIVPEPEMKRSPSEPMMIELRPETPTAEPDDLTETGLA